MKYKELNLIGTEPRDLTTELMFELASARVEDTELVRFNIIISEPMAKKNVSTITKVLKNMKSSGQIQFFATKESFNSSSTEAVFLINKYPELFENIPATTDVNIYFYVKL